MLEEMSNSKKQKMYSNSFLPNGRPFLFQIYA